MVDDTVMQAVFWSLPYLLPAVRVQQPDWAGVITDDPVKGTVLFSPPHSRVASPVPLMTQLNVTGSLGETCVRLGVKEMITGAPGSGWPPSSCPMFLTSMWILHGVGQAALPQEALKATMKEPSLSGMNEAVEPEPDQGPCPENVDVTVQFSLAGQASPVKKLNIPGPQAADELIWTAEPGDRDGMLTDGSAAAGVHETVCEPSGQVTMAGLHESQAQVKGMPEPPAVVFRVMLSI